MHSGGVGNIERLLRIVNDDALLTLLGSKIGRKCTDFAEALTIIQRDTCAMRGIQRDPDDTRAACGDDLCRFGIMPDIGLRPRIAIGDLAATSHDHDLFDLIHYIRRDTQRQPQICQRANRISVTFSVAFLKKST